MSLARRVVLAALAGSAVAGCGVSRRSPQATGGGSAAPAQAAPTAAQAPAAPPAPAPAPAAAPAVPAAPTRDDLVARLGELTPSCWALDGPGVLTALPDGEQAIALTFDACGGPGSDGYDAALIDTLRSHQVPATLFLNARWIDANPEVFQQLAADPLFEIGNHGTRHRPLSVTGRSAYGIAGTADVGEVYDEIAGNRDGLTELLGHPPAFFRAGTAYYDDVAAQAVGLLGERIAGFTVNGDAGATFSASQVHRTVAAADPGSIVIAHMNHPAGGTAAGVAAALPELLDAGIRFVRLSDVRW
ncbi:polysaccharide deacetylase family protein [Kitasatospora sp. NPDC094015]|uniref:polysaccharide deacetylase family protein n=1 Tax=Kitasatospora sp. NPDC094015 TaxID=3155205 RepID=UPI0033178771